MMELEDLTQLLQVLRINERHVPSISQVLQGKNSPACLSIGVRRKLLHYCGAASTPLAAWAELPSPRRQEQELLHRMYCVAEPATHLAQHVNGASVQPYIQANNDKHSGNTGPGLFKSVSLWAKAGKHSCDGDSVSNTLASSPGNSGDNQSGQAVQPQANPSRMAVDASKATVGLRRPSSHKESPVLGTAQAWHGLDTPAAAAVIEGSMREAMVALAAAELAEAEARVNALRARLTSLTSGTSE